MSQDVGADDGAAADARQKDGAQVSPREPEDAGPVANLNGEKALGREDAAATGQATLPTESTRAPAHTRQKSRTLINSPS